MLKRETKFLSYQFYLIKLLESVRGSLFLSVENMKLGLGTAHIHV